MLDFLGLRDTYSEKDLENAILAELEKFILEMGSDFAFFSKTETFLYWMARTTIWIYYSIIEA